MLTPEYLEKIENNKIVEIYNNLNRDICNDIINRLLNSGDISSYTKNQLRILKETNGDEIFKQVLMQVQELDSETMEELLKMYENMARTDLKSYEPLYQYRNLPLKLSASQIKILNYAIKSTGNELRNLTNTVAFKSQQLYTDAVDKAYWNTISGGMSYNDAIKNAVEDLTDKGVTLQDSIGRNVKLETAVKRNVITGIKQTADNINRDIEDYLGCDGYEVTAHSGARPSHQEWQGKQYARTPSGAKKYGFPLWDKSPVSSEINDYNCRHTYFGIILGISTPVYTSSELNALNNKKVVVDGKKTPLYEAKQKESYLQSNYNKWNEKTKTYKQYLEVNESEEIRELYNNAKAKKSEWKGRLSSLRKAIK